MITRRIFIRTLAYGLLAAPLAAEAQQAGKIYRVALLVGNAPVPERWEIFRAAMREYGWTEGVNLSLEIQVGALEAADELVRATIAKQTDVIITVSTAWAVALHRATSVVPIVMAASGYPVEAGLAKSLNRPGGNVTGNAIYSGTEIFGKYLQLLREASPRMTHIGVLWNYVAPAYPDGPIALEELRRAARMDNITLRVYLIRRAEELDAALKALVSEGVHGLFATTGTVDWLAQARIAEFALRQRLPSISDYRWRDETALLLSYAVDPGDLFRRTARFVDRILRGTKPGDLPIELPTKFNFVINLKTAKALGLTIPPSLLLQADELIQ
jgi:putative ABC transport system substrate-binding protein